MIEEKPKHSVIKRCPKCYNLSLEFDSENNRLICTKCGFIQNFLGGKIVKSCKDMFSKMFRR